MLEVVAINSPSGTSTLKQQVRTIQSEVIGSNRKGQITTVNKYIIMTSAIFWVYLGVKTCKAFLRFLSFIFLGSVMLTCQWLLCIHCFMPLVSFKDFTPRMNLLRNVEK